MKYCKRKKSSLVQLLLVAMIYVLTAVSARQPDIESQQLRFDELTDGIFVEYAKQDMLNLHFLLADPEDYGISGAERAFGELSVEAYEREEKSNEELAQRLEEFSRNALREDQRYTYDILDYMIESDRDFQGLELYVEPLSATIGLQAELPMLLAEYTFYDKEDVEDYLYLISQLEDFFNSIIEFERAKSEAGLFMSDVSADAVIESCKAYLDETEQGVMVTTFDERLEALADLTDVEKENYKQENLKIVKESFVPAYKALSEGIDSLKGTGTNDKGLCYFPKGKEYYEYLVCSNVAPSYSSIHKMAEDIERQTAQDAEKMYDGISKGSNLWDKLDSYAFISKDPEKILEQLQQQIQEDFPPLPESDYRIKYVPEALEDSLSPAFYLVPPIDRYYENIIYINGKQQDEDLYTMLAHEGYPGHLYQTVYFAGRDVCDLRRVLSFQSYSEGWATYVQHLAYLFDNGLDNEVAKTLMYNSRISLSIYAFLDIRVNYDGWTREQTEEYLGRFFSSPGIFSNEIFDALVENPTNYLSYYFGGLEIINMRTIAEKKLGDKFEAMEFHRFLLDTGPAPFSLIRNYFDEWMKQEEGAA